jgi:hypothetical protein
MIAFSSEANFLTIHYLEDLFEVVPDIRGAGSGPLVAGGALRLMFIFISSSCITFLNIDGIILRGAGETEEFFLPPITSSSSSPICPNIRSSSLWDTTTSSASASIAGLWFLDLEVSPPAAFLAGLWFLDLELSPVSLAMSCIKIQ